MLIVQVHFRAGARKSHRRQRLQTGPRRREVEQDAEDSIETAIERLYHLVYRTIERAATGPMLRCSGKANSFATSAPPPGTVDVVGIGNRKRRFGGLPVIRPASKHDTGPRSRRTERV